MLNSIIDLYISWHFKQRKLVRCLLKLSGFIIAFASAPIWLPVIIVLYLALTLILGIVEFFEKA